jgi:hypothetical protein
VFKRRQPTPQEQVSRAIEKLERGNLFILRASHTFAFLLIIATSVASLISLASEDVTAITSGQGSVPQDASAVIVLLLVAAMDTGMLYAATSIRIGQQRGQAWGQLRGHLAIMLTVACLEAGTYTYMLWKYENPTTWEAWALIVARGVAVPILSVYLAMARPITVQAEDIAHMTERFTGLAVLKNLVTTANDPDLPLARKLEIYHASATLTPAQATRLNAMHAAVTGQVIDSTISPVEDHSEAPQRVTEPLALPPANEADFMRTFTQTAPRSPSPRPAPKKPLKRSQTKAARTPTPTPDERQEAVFNHLDQHPDTSTRKLAEIFGLSPGTAQADKRAWKTSREAKNEQG